MLTFRVTFQGQGGSLGQNGWLHWIQEVKIYRNRGINHNSSYFSLFFFENRGILLFNKFKLAKISISFDFFFCYLLIPFMGHPKPPEKCYEVESWGGVK